MAYVSPVRKMRKLFTSMTFLAIVCCVLWASPFVPLKIGLQIMPRPLEFAGYRFFLAGFFIMLFLWVSGRKISASAGDERRSAFFGSYFGQVGSQPLFVALFAHFMRRDDRLSWRKAASIMLGLAGLVIVAWDKLSPESFVGWTPVIGMLFLVGNNMTSAFSHVLVSRTKTDKLDPLVFSSSQLMAGGLTLLAVSYVFEGFDGFPVQWEWWASLAVLVFISTVAIGVWFVLLARPGVKVSELNMWKFIIPVVGSLESWAFMPGEYPVASSVVGLVVLTLSLVMLNFGSLRRICTAKSET